MMSQNVCTILMAFIIMKGKIYEVNFKETAHQTQEKQGKLTNLDVYPQGLQQDWNTTTSEKL